MESGKVSMASIGARLKEARQKKALTIEQAQKQTRIHSTVLIALEEGRCDEMLTSTYVKSFLKKYASYLGIDSKQITDEYALLHGEKAAKGVPAAQTANLETTESADPSGLLHVLKKAGIFIIILFLVIFVGTKTIALLKKAKSPARPKMTKQLPPAEAERKVLAKKNLTKANIAPKETSRTVESPQKSIAKNVPLELTIKVRQAVLVQLKKDGVLLFKRVLPKGTTESFTANDNISLYIAKAEALELVLNGKSIGSPGKGVIKNLEITRKGIKIK